MCTKHLLLTFPAVLLAAACGSMHQASAIADVNLQAHSAPFFGSSSTAPLEFDVTIRNKTTAPLAVRSIRISTLNMLEYSVDSGEKLFKETIAPGETKTFPVTATAVSVSAGTSSNEPLSLRADVDFEGTGGKRFHEVYTFPKV